MVELILLLLLSFGLEQNLVFFGKLTAFFWQWPFIHSRDQVELHPFILWPDHELLLSAYEAIELDIDLKVTAAILEITSWKDIYQFLISLNLLMSICKDKMISEVILGNSFIHLKIS